MSWSELHFRKGDLAAVYRMDWRREKHGFEGQEVI